jgi:3-phosphoshikimate 1-carboxyvinyltransferase
MANRIVHPLKSSLAATIRIPSSKSHTQRVLAIAMVTEGVTCINGVGQSADEQAVLQIVKQVAKKCEVHGTNVRIEGIAAVQIPGKKYSIGESGLATRMLIPMLANSAQKIAVIGEGSILKRPLFFFDEVLPKLAVSIQSTEGFLPMVIQGPLTPKSISVDGSLSSQYITGLVYGLVASSVLTNEQLRINKLTSKPYLELSLAVLNQFGVHLKLDENDIIQFNGPYSLQPTTIEIEGDWSSASFFLVAGALYGNMRITNLDIQSTQADKDILHALAATGAKISVENPGNKRKFAIGCGEMA